ncbi:hypothetical protein AXG93_1774s1020 [Marchantia polymorpha subsp. ruderalis]|uniref:Uncharacterized protein n=1 Tax=Marchantia polymorpha subsp. ruderalis TaxID=1480154 RepID=A0A176W2Z5_MARPO|nr:hypothetical protein AXG93_1774s1020 [Marchantia polymorpha subsp. ruderalis]
MRGASSDEPSLYLELRFFAPYFNLSSGQFRVFQRVQAQASPVKERPNECPKPGKREGTETLPSGIVEATSDLERRHLWKVSANDAAMSQNLLAMAVGIKQKSNVDKIIQKVHFQIIRIR